VIHFFSCIQPLLRTEPDANIGEQRTFSLERFACSPKMFAEHRMSSGDETNSASPDRTGMWGNSGHRDCERPLPFLADFVAKVG